jgi:diguanylate cyclase (GGDEF)-like protein
MLIRTSNIYDKDSAVPVSVVGVVTSEAQGAITTENIYKNRSNLDPLTGLYNKAAIKEMAIDALANSDGDVITYVMLDLDHFKEVNDTYGHMFGDEVILNAARIIKEIVGKKGDVGRVGGDEFFIVLKGVGSDLEELRPVLRAIRSQIEWAYKGKLGGIKLTTSIGCASSPKDALNYDDLFKLADRCLYIAKAKGRNRFIIYTREIHGSIEEIMNTDNSIKIGKKVSDSQRLEFVADAVTRLNDWGEGAVNPVIKDMMKYFDVDRIVVYDVATGKPVSTAVPIEDVNENICTYFDSFKETFRETNTLYYGDSVNLKMPYPEFYEYVQKHEFLSLFVYSIKNKGEITHLAVAYTKGRYEKWSDVSVNYLSILFKTIGDKVIKGN